MQLTNLWILFVFLAKERVIGNAIGCQGKCGEPQVNNGDASLTSTEPPGDYDNYGGNYGDYGLKEYDDGTTMSVQCSNGYWFKDTNHSTGNMQCDGCQWSPSEQEACEAAKCWPMSQFGWALKPRASCLPGSRDLVVPMLVNDSACLHCSSGFKFTHLHQEADSIEVKCGMDGKWIIPVTCKNQIECARPTRAERQNTYSKIKANFDAKRLMEFECTSRDFIMFGNPVVKCNAGDWDADPLPRCRHKTSCLLDMKEGKFIKSADSTTSRPWARNNDRVTVVCDSGYTSITGDSEVRCNSGQWNPTPFCVQQDQLGLCVIPVLNNGGVTLSHQQTMPGAVATHRCRDGFQISGSVNRTCLHGGAWDGTDVKCENRPKCGKPSSVDNAIDAPDNKDYYDSALYRYKCRPGYEKRGGNTMFVCDASSRSWVQRGYDNRPVRCEPVNCRSPSTISNTVFEFTDGTRFGSEAKYRCQVGYKKTRGILTSRLCQANERWTVINMECEIKTCPPLVSPPHGSVTIQFGPTNKFEYKSIYKYTCDSLNGYKLKGRDIDDHVSRTCTEHENWSYLPEEPTCELVDCKDPGDIMNGNLRDGQTTYPAMRGFSCDNFTTMDPPFSSHSRVIHCLKNGLWSASLPTCWKKCHVPTVSDGNYRDEWGYRVYPSELEHKKTTRLQCYQDFTTDIRYPNTRTKTLQCSNGTLTLGSCTENPCDELSQQREKLSDVVYSTNVIDVWGTRSKYYSHGTTADITCVNKHETRNREAMLQLTCNKLSWRKDNPICRPKGCSMPDDTTPELRLYSSRSLIGRSTYLSHGSNINLYCPSGVFSSTMKDTPFTTRCNYGNWVNSAVFMEKCEPDPCQKLNKRVNELEQVNYAPPAVTLNGDEYVRNGTRASYDCKLKYEVSENVNTGWLTCDTGSYSQLQEPLCKEKGCRVPSHADSKYVIHEQNMNLINHPWNTYFSHDDGIEVACEDGYVRASTKRNTRVVTSCGFGNWRNQDAFIGQCVEAPCKLSKWRKTGMSVDDNSNGFTIQGETGLFVDHSLVVTVSCQDTHYLAERRWKHRSYTWVATGSTVRSATCRMGRWDPQDRKLSCEPKNCSIPIDTTPGLRLYSSGSSIGRSTNLAHEKNLYLHCPSLKVFSSTMKKTLFTTQCNFGNWSNPAVFMEKCEPVPCQRLNKKVNQLGRVNYAPPAVTLNGEDYVRNGTLASYNCKPNYEVSENVNTGSLTCDSGSYSQLQEPLCKGKSCSAPINTYVYSFDWQTSYVPHGQKVRVSCKAGYEFARSDNDQNDDKYVDCRYGNLTNQPTCRNASCPLTHITNGQFVNKAPAANILHNGDVEFKCNENHLVNLGDDASTSTMTANASPSTSTCVKGNLQPEPKCKRVTGLCNFPKATNGAWYTFEPYKSIGINCTSGLPPTGGDFIIQCDSDGKWRKTDNSNDDFNCQACKNIEMVRQDSQDHNVFRSSSELIALRKSHNAASLEQCQNICLHEETCSSVTYDSSTQECVISHGRMDFTSNNKPTYWKMCESTTATTTIATTTTAETTIATTTTAETTTGAAVSSVEYNCTFDEDFCNWSHDDGSGLVRWRRKRGETPTSDTGPKTDHTTGSGSYIYLETSHVGTGTTARLISPQLGDTEWHCLGFYYNMYSYLYQHINVADRASTLNVYVGSEHPIWTKTIFHSDDKRWLPMWINIAGFSHQKVVLEGVRGMTYFGDIAIDDINLTDGQCPGCDDTNPNCQIWKNDMCPLDSDRMRLECRKTCGYCQ